MVGKAQWFTPINQMKNKEEVWARLENSGRCPPKLDNSQPITFFNNPLKWQWSAEYDRFFAYTKIFPLWDQRKPKDNCQYLPDVRQNIYEQERSKCVPVLTSFNYGLSCRKMVDQPETAFRRVEATTDFKRRNGVMMVKERKPQ